MGDFMNQKYEAARRKYTTISIPKPMYDKLSKMIENTGFSSVSDYVTYIIRDLLAEIGEGNGLGTKKTDEKSEIIKKLRALGYV
jgi:Arc/MetJ-type ribon-helix-helix transcriptional regulator